jgi:heme oxygenase
MSNNLKELTRQHHENAERSEFANLLISGDISPKLYYEYLNAQLLNYTALESAVHVPAELEPIFRGDAIFEDMQELESIYDLEPIEEQLPSVNEYVAHIHNLLEEENDQGLLAHLYVRHFGDAHGGQMIKKKVPGSGTMYEFENRKELIQQVRELLHDGMAEEAKICFEYSERLFHELMQRYHENPDQYPSSEELLTRVKEESEREWSDLADDWGN